MRVDPRTLRGPEPLAKEFTLVDALNPDTPILISVRKLGMVQQGLAWERAHAWRAQIAAEDAHLMVPPQYTEVELSASAAFACEALAIAQVQPDPYTREDLAYFMLLSDDLNNQLADVLDWATGDEPKKTGK